jgi:hypothetical protein
MDGFSNFREHFRRLGHVACGFNLNTLESEIV